MSSVPFADKAERVTACEGYEAAEMECWSMWCEAAAASINPSTVEHLYEHAWGAFELNEC